MREIVPHSDIFTVDAHYVLEELASIHLVRSGGRLAIVDTGTQHSIPHVEAALEELDQSFDDVDLIMLTHIHLDHAGGAGALMQRCPNATLVVHERGARHMADPTKLIAGTVAVYGQNEFNRLYGDVLAINPDRTSVPSDGDSVTLGERTFTFLDSPGHASHHHCIVDSQTGSVFTGDTLGISYPPLRSDDDLFLMPTTTPVQFDPDALHASIDKIMAHTPPWLYLTHYSAVRPTPALIAGLHEQIDEFVRLTERCAQEPEGAFVSALGQRLTDYLVDRCTRQLPDISSELAHKWIRLDAQLNAQGLVFWWNHRRSKTVR
ncbi:MAG: MBL fold metallo-hydrolase [Gammaproteobacteria bacterium]